ncbi:MAG: DUF3179 domain-containing (seleno)protein [Planctomycetota bacterium]|jgi:hypothetical protein
MTTPDTPAQRWPAITAGACLAISLIGTTIGLLALADLIQFVIALPDGVTYTVFAWRWALSALIIVATLAGAAIAWHHRVLKRQWIGLITMALLAGWAGSYFNASYLMFRSQADNARYVPIAQAAALLTTDAEVMVVANGNEAYAFPHDWMTQPHVAGLSINGRPLVMTYCGLSHLGLAFEPVVDGEAVELKVMTQLHNNLVLFDANSQQPIQQIDQCFVGGSPLPQVPSTVMTLGAFTDLYPDGQVFYNPSTNLWDDFTRWIMFDSLNKQFDPEQDVAFPTISWDDQRIAAKEQVYAVSRAGEHATATLAAIQAADNHLQCTVAGSDLTFVYFPQHDYVDLVRGHHQAVRAPGLDGDGNELTRVPHFNRVLWVVFSHFYPGSTVL